MELGLFGGTFDPIHNGHLLIAESLIKDLPLDRILFIPAARPPHKQSQSICPAEHRLRMIQLAIQGQKCYDVSDYELSKNTLSYTTDTVQAFINLYSEDKLFFIIGSDSLNELHTWHQPDRLLDMITMVVVDRPGIDRNRIVPNYRNRVRWASTPLSDISSTQIRERIKNGQSIKGLVPASVLEYIEMNQLYREA